MGVLIGLNVEYAMQSLSHSNAGIHNLKPLCNCHTIVKVIKFCMFVCLIILQKCLNFELN